MTTRRTKNASTILVCSLLLVILCGCDVTIGPKVGNNAIIVKAGTGIEVLDAAVVHAHLLKDAKAEDDGEKVFKQDIGGWIALHPDHWESVKNTIRKLRQQRDELRAKAGLPPIDD